MAQEKKVRVIYVMRSLAHFPYHVTTLDGLVDRGCELTLVFDPRWSRERSTEHVNAWIAKRGVAPFQWAVLRKDGYRKFLFPLRELRSYSSYLRRKEQSAFYLNRWRSYLSKPMQTRLARRRVGALLRQIIGSRLFDLGVRAVESFVPADPKIVQFLKKLSPDVVVASPVDMRFSEEVEYVKAAKAMGIPTAVPVLSWDNLTTKGLMHVKPSLVLAWNQAHADEAIRIHGISPSRCLNSGSPFFDKWFSQACVPKEELVAYCQRIGMDETRPFLTYLGSSKNIAPDETWLIRDLARALAASDDPKLNRLQILARPHPANFEAYLGLKEPNVFLWPKPPFEFQLGVPESVESVRDLYLSLSQAALTIGINTSAMLEAVIVDSPSIALAVSQYEATQDKANHFQHLLNADVLYVEKGVPDSLARISQVIAGKDPKQANRQRFVTSFVRPHGLSRSAGEVQSLAIGLLGEGMPAEEVAAAVPKALSRGVAVTAGSSRLASTS